LIIEVVCKRVSFDAVLLVFSVTEFVTFSIYVELPQVLQPILAFS